MRRLAGIGAAALAAAILLTATGCADGSKAGAAEENHVSVLKLVSTHGFIDPQLQAYARAVARRSHGSLRIAFELNYRPNDLHVETHLIRAAQRGKAQLAWVGARAWEDVGIDSFRPLSAPFLIDSYPLEQRVLRSPLRGQMLAGLRGHGLVGLAVLPGPLRRVEGRKPLLRPADFKGIDFGTSPVPIARATVRALGARPFALASQRVNQLPAGTGGLESHLSAIYGNEYFRKLPYVSMNVILWPRPLVVFASAKTYRSLSPAQQDALQLAGRDAVAASIRGSELDDRDNSLCNVRVPTHLLRAAPDDLAALRRAVQPVYTMLARDPGERAALARIEALKRALGSLPDTGPPCARAQSSAAPGTTPVDGVYRMASTAAQLAQIDGVPVSTEDPANYGTYVIDFDKGRFAFTQESKPACTWGYGTFSVKGQRMAWRFTDGGGVGTGAFNKPGEFFRYGWSIYRDTLTLTPVAGAVSPSNFRITPWQLLSKTPSHAFFNKRCPLPTQALR